VNDFVVRPKPLNDFDLRAEASAAAAYLAIAMKFNRWAAPRA